MKIFGAVALCAALLVGLAGCSFSAAVTVEKSSLAHTGAIALKNEVGTSYLPKVDCGKGSVPLKVGEKIHCDVVDPKAPTDTYDSVLTITKVNGLKYSIDIKVANTPKK